MGLATDRFAALCSSTEQSSLSVFDRLRMVSMKMNRSDWNEMNSSFIQRWSTLKISVVVRKQVKIRSKSYIWTNTLRWKIHFSVECKTKRLVIDRFSCSSLIQSKSFVEHRAGAIWHWDKEYNVWRPSQELLPFRKIESKLENRRNRPKNSVKRSNRRRPTKI